MRFNRLLGKTIKYMYHRKTNVILTLIIAAMTSYIMIYVLNMLNESLVDIYRMNRQVKGKLYTVNVEMMFDMYKFNDNDYSVKMFDKKLREEFGDRYGFYEYGNLVFKEGEDYRMVPLLSIEEQIKDLCTIHLTKTLPDDKIRSDTLKGYVGCNLIDEYPVGSLIDDGSKKTPIQIVGTVGKHDKWLGNGEENGDFVETNLDGYIVTDMDYGYFERDIYQYENIMTYTYVKCDTKEEADKTKLRVMELAKESGVMCFDKTIKDRLIELVEIDMAWYKAMGVLVIFIVVISVMGLVSAALADALDRNYDYAVMLINGVSGRCIYTMIFIETAIKQLIGLSIAVYIYDSKISDNYNKLLAERLLTIPIVAIMAIVIIFLLTGISFNTIKNKNLLEVIGGERL